MKKEREKRIRGVEEDSVEKVLALYVECVIYRWYGERERKEIRQCGVGVVIGDVNESFNGKGLGGEKGVVE